MNAPHINSLSYSELLGQEIRCVITDDNEDFIRTYCGLIPDVVARSIWRVRRLAPTKVVMVYADLVRELALCAEQIGGFKDNKIASICVNIRLHRRLDQLMTSRAKHQEESPVVTEPKPTKPKFNPVRKVA
ncbi:hypothetical protein [Cerasicoccus arenae]|uniref:Uncharacterized protein n=1 Tax=Cerasicoccus arenae TaxID=424488 RepID=A0A8J3DHM1_9BACT|nr:hypothetical protein [Cerasicoccus arenae]MBK1859210.1 hypothetical protein [Cerasicoccus arenae]GHC01309.1 hypothetical protein GCM10007047_17200 [Cerasicoccus arenae]